jgi:PKD repeat protein
MKTRLLGTFAAALALVGAACVHKTEEPALGGPSTLARSITVQAVPDSITQDGASQSSVAITAIGPDGKALSGVAIRVDMMVNGQLADFGTLSARTIVTGNDGVARVIYTAPPAPPPPGNTSVNFVSVRATPIGSDASASLSFTADIRLVPIGVILPISGSPTSSFTFGPTPVQVNVPVNFDASASTPGTNASRIAAYSWNFGDGGSSPQGPLVQHSFTTGGTFNVSLTVTNDRGLSDTSTQSVSVTATDPFTGDWLFSPASPVVGQQVLFNADPVQTSQGHNVTSFSWSFGDQGNGSGPQALHTYAQAGAYNVVLTVVDDLGRRKVFPPKVIAVGTGQPVPAITFSPSQPVHAVTTVNFSSNGTTTFGGATIVSYQWDFGDGASSGNANPTHVYGLAGAYTVTLTVVDSQNRVGIARTTVTVS